MHRKCTMFRVGERYGRYLQSNLKIRFRLKNAFANDRLNNGICSNLLIRKYDILPMMVHNFDYIVVLG